jgi:mRNA-degrading endonuclease YafQ of YafQ-DinJ toxin-antitoxin module
LKLALAERFQRDLRALEAEQRALILETILALPGVLGEPHRHAGLGVRKLHASGIWEARVGLGLRIVFSLEPGFLTLVRAGSHDEIRRFLREL